MFLQKILKGDQAGLKQTTKQAHNIKIITLPVVKKNTPNFTHISFKCGRIELDKVTLYKWSRELSAAGDVGSART